MPHTPCAPTLIQGGHLLCIHPTRTFWEHWAKPDPPQTTSFRRERGRSTLQYIQHTICSGGALIWLLPFLIINKMYLLSLLHCLTRQPLLWSSTCA